MKIIKMTVLMVLFLLVSCGNGKVGSYKKEPMPENFSYKILEDKSNVKLEKNQLTIEINQKISEGQIATLAEKLFNSKEKQRRFYIFYLLPDMKIGSGAWATSHFDPELEIEILGSTTAQDENVNTITNEEIDGEIIGRWHENQYTSANYIIYVKNDRTFLKIVYKNGQTAEEELSEKKVQNGTRFDYKGGAFNGEYFVVNSKGSLEFYNSENKNFTTANSLN